MQIERANWGDSALGRELIKEVRQGIALKEAWENRREIAAAKEAQTFKNARTLPGLGKHAAEIPAWEYYNLIRKYGYDQVHSREFMRDLQKRFPHLATAKV